MWRAWGIAAWLLSQDAAPPPFNVGEHEFSLRPPAGWVAQPAMRPSVVRFLAVGAERKAEAELLVTHLISTNPTPLKAFEEQARKHILERYKSAKIAEEKSVTLGGRPAFRVVFADENGLYVKTAVWRTHLEYYLLDIFLPKEDPKGLRKAAEAAVDTFQIVPAPLSPEESDAFARGLAVLKAAKPDPAWLGERWYGLYFGPKKAGHQRIKVAESEGLIAFEADVVLDLGDGNRDATTVRGAFSLDGRRQRVESDQVKTNDQKERWQFRAAADLQDGKLKVSRDMNGHKEEKTLDVPEGLLLADVAEFLRGALAVSGEKTTLIKTISPFSDEPNIELIEAGGPEKMDVDGRRVDAVVALCRIDRRKTQAYTYGMDRLLLRQGGAKDVFSVRRLPKDEALKP